jgi:hypothetical protein
MKSEEYIRKIYDEKVEFLKECDGIPEEGWSVERADAHAAAVTAYQLLHDILEIPGEPEWCD